MRKNKRLFVNLFSYTLFIAFIICSSHFIAQPPAIPKKDETSPIQFSAEYAMEHIKEIAQKSRPTGSAYNQKAREYIKGQIESTGLTVEEEVYEIKHKYEERIVEVHNLVTRIEGTNNSGELLFIAHYDSVEEGPGANDDAAGVAVLLETMKIVKNASPLKNNVTFLFADGEEDGILGSTAYTKHHDVDNIALVINVEARGNKGKSMLFETQENNYQMVKEFITAASKPYGYSFVNDIYKLLPNYTDYQAFKEKGIQGLNFAYIEGLNVYHNEKDTIESVSLSSVQHQGLNAVELVKYFGNLNFQSLEVDDDEKAVFFNIFGYQTIMYSAKYNVLISIISLLFFAFATILTFKLKATTLKGIKIWLLSVTLLLLSLLIMGSFIISSIAIYQIYSIKATLLPIGIGVFIIGVISLFSRKYKLILKWIQLLKQLSIMDIVMGNLFIGNFISLVACYYLASSHYLFTIPVCIQSLIILIHFSFKKYKVLHVILSFIFIIPIILLLYPLWYVLSLSLGVIGLPFLLMAMLITFPYMVPLWLDYDLKKV